MHREYAAADYSRRSYIPGTRKGKGQTAPSKNRGNTSGLTTKDWEQLTNVLLFFLVSPLLPLVVSLYPRLSHLLALSCRTAAASIIAYPAASSASSPSPFSLTTTWCLGYVAISTHHIQLPGSDISSHSPTLTHAYAWPSAPVNHHPLHVSLIPSLFTLFYLHLPHQHTPSHCTSHTLTDPVSLPTRTSLS